MVNELLLGGGAARRVRVTRLVGGTETVSEVSSSETVLIAAHVPHLFEFLEDTVMTEVWRHPRTHTQCPFDLWYYRPFRDRVDAATLAAAEQLAADSSRSADSGSPQLPPSTRAQARA